MAIQGLRDTSGFTSGQRPNNWREVMLTLEPNGMAPLTALTSLMKKRDVDDPTFYWFEKEQQTRRMALGANIDTSQTAITIVTAGATSAGAKSCVAGDILLVEQTGELLRVMADPTDDTALAVSRGFAGSTAAAVTYAGAGVNPNVTIIGNAFEEGSLPPTGVNFDPTNPYNYTQIFRKTLEITRTAAKTRLRTGDAVAEAKRECLELLSIDMERAYWFGKRASTTQNGKPLRTMAGVEAWIDSGNIVTADTSSGVDMTTFEGYMCDMFKYGSSEKFGFCGNKALLTIQQIIRKNSTYQLMQGQKEFGMNVTRLVCPFGTLVLKTHPLFNRMAGGVTASTAYYGRESYLYVLDMKELMYVTFKGDDVKYQPKLEDNGLDGQQSGYIAETSLEMHFGKSHYLLKNLAKAKADA